ncbi:MAG: HAD-IA family hydrolase [Thaumarchaeota archaeon]|nr:HAD-IA family hydrolase [Nitrososphaerota archaeon]
MVIRAVFFDLGGTLLVMRRSRIFRTVINEAGRDAPLHVIDGAYMRLEGWWLSTYAAAPMTPGETDEAYRHLYQKVFSSLFPDADQAEAMRVSRRVRERWPVLEKNVPLELYHDVEPTLGELKRGGYALGLISNAPADTEKVVVPLGLDRYLPTIVFSGIVGYTKPHPEIFNIAMKRAGARPEESVHVGDLYEADVVGARNAGMKGLLIDRAGTHGDTDCPTISSLAQIYTHL